MPDTILTIEDDAAIREGIVDVLQFHGYQVLQSDNGDEGLTLALNSQYDLLLLDLALPERSGMSILQELRRKRSDAAVIVLTAKGSESDRVDGLRAGADDYIVKPFSVKELVARVEAVLRRIPHRKRITAMVSYLGGSVDFDRCEIRFQDGRRVALSERESALLSFLIQNVDRAISRQELLSAVWGLDPKGISTRTIDMHVARLREKLNDKTDPPSIIQTVRGKGYMWAGTQPMDE